VFLKRLISVFAVALLMHFTVRELAADWHDQMVPLCGLLTPSTSAATLELYIGLELEERLTELISYVVLRSIM